MEFRKVKYFYWGMFLLTILVLFQNVGIVLIGLAIIILPAIFLHIHVGRKLDDLKKRKQLVIISAVNFLAFSLVRPEGAHALNMTGLSEILDMIGIYTFNPAHEGIYVFCSLVLIVSQVIIDLRLNKVLILKG